MKKIRSVKAAIFFTVVFSIPAIAQPTAPTKIVLINSFAFGDEKAGVTKYIDAVKRINAEFAPVQKELETMNTKLSTLAKEIQIFRDQDAGGKVPVDQKAAQAKVDEAEKLQRDIKFRSEDAKARYEKRQQTVLGPVMQDIGKAVQDFAKQKGYTLIFDIAKDEAGFLLAIGDEKIDVTKEFITFYNTRPSSAGVTPAPK